MDYANSVQGVLLRKIQKAEQEVMQLKLDYCRFVFGLTHRSRVVAGGKEFVVRSVNVDSMSYLTDGSFSRPELTGVPTIPENASESVQIGRDWVLANAKAT